MLRRTATSAFALASFALGVWTDAGVAGAIFDGHFYEVTDSFGSWTDAEAYAVSQGGHLVTIDGPTENEFIRTTFLTISGSQEDFWIGLYSPIGPVDDPDTYSWISGSDSTYRNWRGGQPDLGGGTDGFVAINFLLASNGTWDNYPDTGFRSLRGIYEIAIIPEPSTAALIALGFVRLIARRMRR